MLPTFRILLATTGLAMLAVALSAHGLISTPEVHTRIGEVPAVSRSLIQQAMVPRVPVQALSNPVEERPALVEATGMAPGPGIVRLPADQVDSVDSDRTAPSPAKAGEEAEPSDPLGELIKTTILQTPVPPPTVVAEPNPALPPETAGRQHPVPIPNETAAPVEAVSQPLLASRGVTLQSSNTPSADTTQADGMNVTPAKSADIAEAVKGDTAPPPHGNNVRVPTQSMPPTLALGGEPADRANANTKSQSKTPAATTAALHGSDNKYSRSPAQAGKRRDRSARKAIGRRKAVVEKRAVRRKAITKSRATLRRKSQAARRVKRHKSRRLVNAAPRRSAPTTSAPAGRYHSPAYRYQVEPSGYYTPVTGATAVR